jgi:hypothetical protein
VASPVFVSERYIGVSQSGVRQGVIRVLFDRSLEMPNRCLEIQFDLIAAKSSGSALVPEKPTTEVSILYFRVHRAGTGEVSLL